MAVFLLNECKFNNCGLCFKNLYDLIQHIEDKHIGKKTKNIFNTFRFVVWVDAANVFLRRRPFYFIIFTSMSVFHSLPFSYQRNDLFVPRTVLPPPMDLSDPIVQLCIFKFRSFPRLLKK